jgi:hypothetical protein
VFDGVRILCRSHEVFIEICFCVLVEKAWSCAVYLKDYSLNFSKDEGNRVLRSSFTYSLCQLSWCRVPEYWNICKHHCENIKSRITSATLFSDVSSDEETTSTAMLEVTQMMSKEVIQKMLKEDQADRIEAMEQLLCFFYSCLPYEPSYAILHIFISSHNSVLSPLVDAKTRQTSFDAMLHVYLRSVRPRTPAFCC